MNYHKFILSILAIAVSCSTMAQPVTGDANVPQTYNQILYQTFPYPYLNNYSDTSLRNYVRVYTLQAPVQNDSSVVLAPFQGVSLINTVYYDGQGRPMQEVGYRANSNLYDMVKVHVYDNTGRESISYLPYSTNAGNDATWTSNRGRLKPTPLDQLKIMYNALYYGDAPYTKTVYDNSPLARKMAILPPGADWVVNNRGTYFGYATNASTEVTLWTIGTSNTDAPVNSGYYAPGELFVTQATDADGKIAYEYKDKQGRVVLKKQQINGTHYSATYNVYDDFGRLRYVIPPEAVTEAGGPANWNLTQNILDGLCYSYFYDQRGRVVEKKLPGADVIYYVYDDRDNVVLKQDGNERNNNVAGLAKGTNLPPSNVRLWEYTIYDGLDRPIQKGIYIDSNANSRQTIADDMTSATIYPTNNLFCYLKNDSLYERYPDTLSSCTLLSRYYYDDYSNTPSGFAYTTAYNAMLNGANAGSPSPVTPSKCEQTRGMLTGSMAEVMGNTPDTALNTVYYYDPKARLIQQQKANQQGGIDITSNQYEFDGTLISSVIHHDNPNAISYDPSNPAMQQTTNIVQTFFKDYGSGKVVRMSENVNGTGPNVLYSNNYDALNRLSNHQTGSFDNKMTYNVQGWLTGINPAYLTTNTFTNAGPFFGEALSYDHGFASHLYNGNIAGIIWKGSGSGAQQRSYGYSYDNINRLTYANFNQYDSTQSNWVKTNTDYTVSNLTYDDNGNIKTAHRRGPGYTSGSILGMVDMDMLKYDYQSGTNQLTNVTDSTTYTTDAPDFKDGNIANSSGQDDYGYDHNGNLDVDRNKKIQQIAYDYLNQPTSIDLDTIGKIYYVYDALGNKLQKLVVHNGDTTHYDYIGRFVYRNDSLQYITHSEGRYRPTNTSTNGVDSVYTDYYIKDHLGNVREVVNQQSTQGYNNFRSYLATHELAAAQTEQLLWFNMDSVRTTKDGSTDPNDLLAATLIGTNPDKRVGTSIMLRVMPGDKFSLFSDAYYDGLYDTSHVSASDMATAMLNTLAGGNTFNGTPVSEIPNAYKNMQSVFESPSFIDAYSNMVQTIYDSTEPAAFLNYFVVDQNMRIVPNQSGSIQVAGRPGSWHTIGTLDDVTIGQNGWLIVSISSNSSTPVEFDNVGVVYYTGSMLEEDHYYPFGLTLSDDAAGAHNDYKFQTQQQDNDFGINIYNFKARQQDPELGRFWQYDPLADKYTYNSTYAFSENRVTNAKELEGKEAWYINNGSNQFTFGPYSNEYVESNNLLGASYQAGNYAINIEGISITGIPAEVANLSYGIGPYAEGTTVTEMTASEDMTGFSRVFTEGETQPVGRWVMKTEDIKGLSPSEIQSKFSLPNKPTDVVDVTIPKGTTFRKGEAASAFGGKGGGTQYELKGDLNQKNFSNPTKLSEPAPTVANPSATPDINEDNFLEEQNPFNGMDPEIDPLNGIGTETPIF